MKGRPFTYTTLACDRIAGTLATTEANIEINENERNFRVTDELQRFACDRRAVPPATVKNVSFFCNAENRRKHCEKTKNAIDVRSELVVPAGI